MFDHNRGSTTTDAAALSFTPNDNGSFVATCVVTDDDGGAVSVSSTITVTNVAPDATITGAPDGSIPEASVRILQEVGQWMSKNGDTIYKSDHCEPRRSAYASYTRTGNTLFMHVHYWPGGDVNMCGLKVNAKSVRLFASNQKVEFKQDAYLVIGIKQSDTF